VAGNRHAPSGYFAIVVIKTFAALLKMILFSYISFFLTLQRGGMQEYILKKKL